MDFEVVVNGSTFTPSILEDLEVIQKLNDIGTFRFTISGEENFNANEGDDILLSIRNLDDSLTPLVSGEVRRVRRRREESEAIFDIEGSDTVSTLQFRVRTHTWIQQDAKGIILDLIQELQTDGFLSNDNSYIENIGLDITYSMKNETVLTAIQNISKFVNRDFYVDSDKKLHWFDKEKYSTGVTLEEDDLENSEYYRDADNIINEVYVSGAQYRSPDDDDLTEHSNYWSSINGTVSLGTIEDELTPQAGKYSIKCSGNLVNLGMKLQDASATDLTVKGSPDTLHFMIGALSAEQVTKVRLEIGTPTNYFYRDIDNLFPSIPRTWREVTVPIGPDSTGWFTEGTPSWSNFLYLGFKVTYTSAIQQSFFIDDLYFEGARFNATEVDVSSQALWGLRVTPDVQDDNIKSFEEATIVAETIISEFKDPRIVIDNIELADSDDSYVLGKTVTLQLPELPGGSVTKRIVTLTQSNVDGEIITRMGLETSLPSLTDVIESTRAQYRRTIQVSPETPTSMKAVTTPDLTIEDIDEVPDVPVSPPTITVIPVEIDTATEFAWWIEVTVTAPVTSAGGYLVGYKKLGENKWNYISIPQFTDAEGTFPVRTIDLEESEAYEVQAYSVSKLGAKSSGTVPVTFTPSNSHPFYPGIGINNTAPPTPTNLDVTGLTNGLLITWDNVVASDLDFYKVYMNTTSNPFTAVEVGSVKGNVFQWRIKDSSTDYSVKHVWVVSVDTAGNESSKQQDSESDTPLTLQSSDLNIELRNWTTDVKFSIEDGDYDYIEWTSGYIKWSSGSTSALTSGSASNLPDGISYFYWNNTSTIQVTQDYSLTVGKNLALLAVAYVQSDANPTVIPINGYVPVIGAGVIAAHSIFANHLDADNAVITKQIQIGDNTVLSDAIVNIGADKVVIDGTVYLTDWRDNDGAGNYTKIKGGQISANSIDTTQLKADSVTSTQIKANNVTASKLSVDAIQFDVSRENLVVLYPLDSLGAGNFVADYSNEENNGVAYNGTLVQGRFGNGLQFVNNGTIKINTLKNLSGDAITIELWFKGTNASSLFRQQSGANYIILGDSMGQCSLSNDGGTASGISLGTITDNIWHHLVLSWKRNTTNGFKVFKDGILVAERNSSNTALPNINVESYLGSLNNTTEFMNGILDEIRVYKGRALTPEEVRSSYRLGAMYLSPTVITKNMIKTHAITADAIDAGAIKAEHIQSGAITTSNLRLARLTSDPATLEPGMMWWRTNLPNGAEQLRFQSDSRTEWIPKFPLNSEEKDDNLVVEPGSQTYPDPLTNLERYKWYTIATKTIHSNADTWFFHVGTWLAYQSSAFQGTVSFRVYDVTSNMYYPNSDGLASSVYGSGSSSTGYCTSCTAFITVPKNLNTHTVRIQFNQGILNGMAAGSTTSYWGHDEHRHMIAGPAGVPPTLTVSTQPVESVGMTTAILKGSHHAINSKCNLRGFRWKLKSSPSWYSSWHEYSTEYPNASYTHGIDGLTLGTTYEYQAYAEGTGIAGREYASNLEEFTTLSSPPPITASQNIRWSSVVTTYPDYNGVIRKLTASTPASGTMTIGVSGSAMNLDTMEIRINNQYVDEITQLLGWFNIEFEVPALGTGDYLTVVFPYPYQYDMVLDEIYVAYDPNINLGFVDDPSYQ